MNCGLILEGGGMRGTFTMGVLDYFEDQNIRFPMITGVSAGASNACSYVSRQRGRNIDIAHNFSSDRRYLSWTNLIKKGSVFGMDFGFRTIPAKLNVFDFDSFRRSSAKLYIGATNCLTGKADFYDSSQLTLEQLTDLLIASCSLPIMGNIHFYQDIPYLDGGVADSIPIDFALTKSNKAVVVLTRENNYRKKKTSFLSKFFIKQYFAKYPQLADSLLNRYQNYNNSLQKVQKLSAEGRVFIIQPQTKLPAGRTQKNPDKLTQNYRRGYEQARADHQKLIDWLAR